MMNFDTDLTLEVEFIASSSPVMQHHSGVALAVIDDGSASDDRMMQSSLASTMKNCRIISTADA
jgi:hypothetical protein